MPIQNYEFKPWKKEPFKFYIVCTGTGNVLRCNQEGFVICDNSEVTEELEWTAVIPDDTNTITSNGIIAISICTVVDASLLPVTGLVCQGLVPTAMSTFGTVVSGVGTFHAPLSGCGAASILQSTSAALLSTSGLAGGVVGGASVAGMIGTTIAPVESTNNSNVSSFVDDSVSDASSINYSE